MPICRTGEVAARFTAETWTETRKRPAMFASTQAVARDAPRGGVGAEVGGGTAGVNQRSVYTGGQTQTQAGGDLGRARSGLHDSSDAGAGADLRSRSSDGNLRLPRGAKRPAGSHRGGGAGVPWPSGRRRRRPRGLLRDHSPSPPPQVTIPPPLLTTPPPPT